jgi:urease accessory protein
MPAWTCDSNAAGRRRPCSLTTSMPDHCRCKRPCILRAPAICHLAVLHPPGGIAGGDRLIVDAAWGRRAGAADDPGCVQMVSIAGRVGGAAAALLPEWRGRARMAAAGDHIFRRLAGCNEPRCDLGPAANFSGGKSCVSGAGVRRAVASGSIASRYADKHRGALDLGGIGKFARDSGFLASPVGLAGCTVSGTFLAAGFTREPAARGLPRGR